MSRIQNELQKLLTKKMGRREFLAHIGAGLLAIVGISNLLKQLINYDSGGKTNPGTSSGGYGSSSYGGKKR